jgi:hypothetical protein
MNNKISELILPNTIENIGKEALMNNKISKLIFSTRIIIFDKEASVCNKIKKDVISTFINTNKLYKNIFYKTYL